MGGKEGLKIARRGAVSKRGQVLGFGIVYRMQGRMKNDEWGGEVVTRSHKGGNTKTGKFLKAMPRRTASRNS